jgi:hypothetical protein
MTKEITPFYVGKLATAAAQLKVTLEVDPALLREEVEQYTQGLSTVQLAVKNLQVNDEESYQQCIELRNDAGRREKGLTDIWKRYKGPLNAARQVVLDYEHETVDVCKAAKDLATKKGEQYIMEQRRAQRAAEEQMAEAARKLQRDLERKASDLALTGQMKEAEQVTMQAQMAVAPRLPSAVPVAVGARVGEKYTARVMDVMAVLKSIVDGQTPLMWEVKPGDVRQLVVVDEVVLRAIVLRQITGLRIPGVVVEEGAKISSTPGGR